MTRWAMGLSVGALLIQSVLAQGETPQVRLSEQPICDYREDATGGFSHCWVAYLVEPDEDSADKTYYVDINGKRLGPYAAVSRLFAVSPDGTHIAFAAQKEDKWWIVLDGEEKWNHAAIGWARYSWSASLDGQHWILGTPAPVLVFSRDGTRLAYQVRTADGTWAFFVNGRSGPTFGSVGRNADFAGDDLTYPAWPENGIVQVYGETILGPYETTWPARFSPNKEHFCFVAKRGEEEILVADGRDIKVAPDIGECEISSDGELAYSYKSGGVWKVSFRGSDLATEFDEVRFPTLSPDGKQVAFWARKGAEWSVATDTREYPGFDGFFFEQFGDVIHAVLCGPRDGSVAYLAREGQDVVFVVDGAKRARPRSDQVSYLAGGELACVESQEEGSFMVIGSAREGPYKEIRGGLITSEDGKHRAYVVSTDQGQQVVLDGSMVEPAYEGIYRPVFLSNGQFAALGVRQGQLFRIAFGP